MRSSKYYRYHTLAFLRSKFLITNYKNLFVIKQMRWATDFNKNTFLSLFWVYFILFGQAPHFVLFNKHMVVEKISHGSLVINKAGHSMHIFLQKFVNYFFLFTQLESIQISRKIKSKISNLSFSTSTYFSEVSVLNQNLFLETFKVAATCLFNTHLTLFEKVTTFRMLQLPITLFWLSKKQVKNRNVVLLTIRQLKKYFPSKIF